MHPRNWKTSYFKQMRHICLLEMFADWNTHSPARTHTHTHGLGAFSVCAASQPLTEPPLFGSDPLKRRLKPAAIPRWIWTLSRVTRRGRPGPGLFTQTRQQQAPNLISRFTKNAAAKALRTAARRELQRRLHKWKSLWSSVFLSSCKSTSSTSLNANSRWLFAKRVSR